MQGVHNLAVFAKLSEKKEWYSREWWWRWNNHCLLTIAVLLQIYMFSFSRRREVMVCERVWQQTVSYMRGSRIKDQGSGGWLLRRVWAGGTAPSPSSPQAPPPPPSSPWQNQREAAETARLLCLIIWKRKTQNCFIRFPSSPPSHQPPALLVWDGKAVLELRASPAPEIGLSTSSSATPSWKMPNLEEVRDLLTVPMI